MSGEDAFHIEILSEAQKRVLPDLARALVNMDFYMAGGTGLALQLGHRSSFDFDWFTPKVGNPEELFNRLKGSDIVFEIQSISLETVYITVNEVQMSFIGYDYPMLQPKVLWPEYGIHLAGTNDIACMKLSAVASRGSRKDFIDLHYLFTHHLPPEKYLELYSQKYKSRDVGHVVRSLVYFADADVEPEIKTIGHLDWEEIKSDFEKWVTELKIK